jgi:nucleoid DNA-binding protein
MIGPRSRRRIGRDHPLAKLLVANGFSSREAQRTVNALFEVIKEALKRHETVQVPFGTFRVVANLVQPYRRWRCGRPVVFYRKRCHVEFTPYEEAHDE